MATILRRLVGVARGRPPMTEPEAYNAYQAHVSACGGCGTGRTPEGGWGNIRCQLGLELHGRWQAAVAVQQQGDRFARQERERATAGRR